MADSQDDSSSQMNNDRREGAPAQTAAHEPPPAAVHEALQNGGQNGSGGSGADPNRPATHHIGDGKARPVAVVGMGGSAGGVQVLQEVFGDMPPDSGLA